MNRSNLLRGIFWIVLAASFAGLIMVSYVIYSRQVDKIELLKKNLKLTHRQLKNTKDELADINDDATVLAATKEDLSKKVSLQETRIEQFQKENKTLEYQTEGLSVQKERLEATLEVTKRAFQERIKSQKLKMTELEIEYGKKSAMEKAMFVAQEKKSNEKVMAAEVLLEALTTKNQELAVKTRENREKLLRLIEERDTGIGSGQGSSKGESDLRKKISDLNMMINQNKKLIAENKKTVLDVTNEKERIANQLQQTEDQFKDEAFKLHYNLGLAYDESRQHKEAVAEYEKALEINRDDADLHYNMAIIYHEQIHDLVKAIEHYNAYIELSPDAQDVDKVRHWMEVAKKELTYSTQK